MAKELKSKSKNNRKLNPILKELAELDNPIYKPRDESSQRLSEQINEACKSANKLLDYIKDTYKPVLIQANQISKLLNSFTWPNNINPTKEEVEKSIDSIVNEIEKKPVSAEKVELVNVLKGIKLDKVGTTKEKVSLEKAREILKTNNPNITDEEVLENLAFIETLADVVMTKILNMRKGVIS